MGKITAYGSLAAPAAADVIPIVDVDNFAMAASGTTMKTTVAALGTALAPFVFIQPSGDATGATDLAAINAPLAAGKLVALNGAYTINGALTPASGSGIYASGPALTTVTQTSSTANGVSVVSASAISDVTLQGFTLQGPNSGSGIGIYGSANSGSANIERLSIRNVVVGGFGSHGIQVQNAILSELSQVKSWFNGGRGFYLQNGTTWKAHGCWASHNVSERGWYLTGLLVSTLTSCGSDNNALGYEVLNCYNITLDDCDAFNTAAGSSGLDGSTFKVNASFGVNLLGPYAGSNGAVGVYVTGSSSGCFISGVTETAAGGATASVKTDSGTSVVIIGVNVQTAPSYASGTALFLSPGYTFFSNIEAGVATVDGLLTLGGGTKTAGSAPVLTGLGAASGTAIQLSDTARDYMVYLEVTTAGTATSLTMGHTNTANDVTILSSVAVAAGDLFSFRLPAGWWFKWTGTTTAIGNQNAVGC